MLDFGYKLRNAQKQVLEFAAAQTEDIVPGFEPDGVDFTGKGFLALPQVCYKEHVGGKTQSAHFEAGNWMSKMAVHPERNYDDVIKRTIDLKLAEDKSGKSRFIAVDDFIINALVRFYAQFKGRSNVGDALWERVKTVLLKAEYAPYHEQMSENHKICYLSSELIAAELFPDEVFFDGETGGQRLFRVKRAIRLFLEKRFRRGWSEFDSGSYYPVDCVSLLNIFDFSEDAEMRRLASDSINSMMAAMYHHSVKGYPAGPKGRIYLTVAENAKLGMYYCMKAAGAQEEQLFFEEPLSTAVVYFALSSFQLDDEVYQIAFGEKKSSYEVRESNALYSIPDDMYLCGRIKKYFYVGQDYALGSIVERDDPFENIAYTWLCGHQEQAWSLTFGGNSKAVIFSSHPGNEKLHDFGMHGYWLGDSNCLCSKFAQDKNVMLAYYDIQGKKQSQFVHIFLPEKEFDEVLYREDFIIVRCREVCALLTFSDAYFVAVAGDNAGREIILPYPRCGFLVEVVEKRNLAEIENMRSSLKMEQDGISAVTADGKTLSIIRGKTFLDGNEQQFHSYPLYESPYVKSEYDSGQIVVQFDGKRRVYGIK